MFPVISGKHRVAKVLLAIWEMFLYESNCNYNSYKFNHTYAFIPLFSFRENQKKESNLQQVGSLVTENFSFSVYGE